MGGAPTFGFDPLFATDDVIGEVKKVSNYQTNHSGFFVFRLTPKYALNFFGERAKVFSEALGELEAPLAAKYKLIGNLFAPDQAIVPIKELHQAIVN